jgi:hypothetical protein
MTRRHQFDEEFFRAIRPEDLEWKPFAAYPGRVWQSWLPGSCPRRGLRPRWLRSSDKLFANTKVQSSRVYLSGLIAPTSQIQDIGSRRRPTHGHYQRCGRPGTDRCRAARHQKRFSPLIWTQ